MPPFRFRGHHTGVDLAATVARFPSLAGRADAEDRLAEALQAEGEARAEALRAEIAALIRTWDREARAWRRSKLRGSKASALRAVPDRLKAAVASIEDGAAMIDAAIPRGILQRLATREPAARVQSQDLEDLERILSRRVDPAVARTLGTDEAVEAAVARIVDGAANPDPP